MQLQGKALPAVTQRRPRSTRAFCSTGSGHPQLRVNDPPTCQALDEPRIPQQTRRHVLTGTLTALVAAAAPAHALDRQEIARRRKKIPIEAFVDGPQGLKLYDIVEGAGAEAKVGQRVAVHYDVKFRNVTFVTSRVGMGVTGGTPVGFNIGVEAGSAGSTLAGIDLGVRGMRVGGLRRLIVPPELAYGERGVGEIPGNATLTVDLELLSIKTSPLGFRTKLVEG